MTQQTEPYNDGGTVTRFGGFERSKGRLETVKIHQRGVQWKQGVVICMLLYTSLLYNTTPIRCTRLRLHPPVMNTRQSQIPTTTISSVISIIMIITAITITTSTITITVADYYELETRYSIQMIYGILFQTEYIMNSRQIIYYLETGAERDCGTRDPRRACIMHCAFNTTVLCYIVLYYIIIHVILCYS